MDPPRDPTVTTLWVGGLPEEVTEQDLFNALFVFGGIAGVSLLRPSRCAFVQFAERGAAEAAMAQLGRSLPVGGRALPLNWAAARGGGPDPGGDAGAAEGMLAPPGLEDAPVASYSLEGEEARGASKRPRLGAGAPVYASTSSDRLESPYRSRSSTPTRSPLKQA